MVELHRDTENGIETIRVDPGSSFSDYIDQGWRLDKILIPDPVDQDKQDQIVETPSPKKRNKKYRCHRCNVKITEKHKNVVVQAVTGRVFCSQECIDEHLSSKGF
jgi:hypothetical protein